ncbi:unnamed protein product [Mytilus coruscus]|uniref:Uncharacterized protein n=1 Tax=Mytilus coruscus TaxID=42192 RepID=A0A6J8DC77_MYTCO|nr:unnamed protein product [Mytilus coruscus]
MTMVLEDVRGQPLPAIDVFSLSIKALKDHLDRNVRIQNNVLDDINTKWVLTVPAIWTDTAKQFMRKSAEEAGISRDMLTIALEPEAASMYCQTFPSPGCRDISEIGSRYMVVDLGGGTIDVTVHEKNPDGTLKEVTKASGNGCGGTSIDDEFIQLFDRMFGESFVKSLKSEFPESYLFLLRNIENIKKVFQPEQIGMVNLRFPYALRNLCKSHCGKSIEQVISSSTERSYIELFTDKIRIGPMFVKSLFPNTCKTIISVIKSVLQQETVPDISTILLVGGFSECKMIQNAIVTAFPRLNIFLPEDPGLVVLKGAVLFGYKPDFISSRISRYTYGIRVKQPFDETTYDRKRKQIFEGKTYCYNIFKPFMNINTRIPLGHTIEKLFTTHSKSGCLYEVFYTDRENVKYTDTGECTNMGKINICFLNPDSKKRKMKVVFNFGDTELSVLVVDLESKTEKKEFFEIQR